MVEVDQGDPFSALLTGDFDERSGEERHQVLVERDRQELEQLLVNGTISLNELADAIFAKRENKNPDYRVE